MTQSTTPVDKEERVVFIAGDEDKLASTDMNAWLDKHSVRVSVAPEKEHGFWDDEDPSWWAGSERDPDWDLFLKKSAKRWVVLIVAVCWPTVCVFMIPITKWLITGQWFAAAFGAWYGGHWEGDKWIPASGAIESVPSVMMHHFIAASAMLALMLTQVGSAACMKRGLCCFDSCCRVRPGSKADKGIRIFHRWNGWLMTLISVTAVTLGTTALALCDPQPKRGIETMFFVLIGIEIVVSLIKAVNFATDKKFGLHMQYIFYAVMGICSPGWNRITTILIRFIWGGTKAFTDPRVIECFYRQTWLERGYKYTWSFIIGEVWVIFWWLVVPGTRQPMFKKGSVGFWMLMFQAGILLFAGVESVWSGRGLTYSDDFECTAKDHLEFNYFKESVARGGMYSMSSQFGVCAPWDETYLINMHDGLVNQLLPEELKFSNATYAGVAGDLY